MLIRMTAILSWELNNLSHPIKKQGAVKKKWLHLFVYMKEAFHPVLQ